MDELRIRGGHRLQGTVSVSGAKNAALPIMAATLAIPGRTILHNFPRLRDTNSMIQLLTQFGVAVEFLDNHTIALEPGEAATCRADYELVRTMRASVCVLGPLLASQGEACVSLPGGCNIGHRPIDLHLKGLSALGAEIVIDQGYIHASARELRGAEIYLGGAQGSTVTGTCNVMSAAVLAQGRTIIQAAACEPEVVDLGNFLNTCGARISGLGTSTLTIDGVRELHAAEYAIIPDRIEAATWMMAAGITNGDLTIEGVREDHLAAVIETLRTAGLKIELQNETARVQRAGELKPLDVVALPFPGFPTDLQAQLTAMMCLAFGTSVVTDRIFPDRFLHAAELLRMGAKIRRESSGVVIEGVNELSGACVMASDLRASAALVLAGLAARGETVISRIYHLDRGYEDLAGKLSRLDAEVERQKGGGPNPPHFASSPTPSASKAPPKG